MAWKVLDLLLGGIRAAGRKSPITTEILCSPQLDQALKTLIGMSSGRSFSVLPELRKTAKYLRKQHGMRMRKHVSPDGAKWPMVEIKELTLPRPRLDGYGPIAGNALDNLRWARLSTERQVSRSAELVGRLQNHARTGKVIVPALYRTRGYYSTQGTALKYSGKKGQERKAAVKVAGRLFGMLTKDRVAGSGTRIHRLGGAYELLYGLSTAAAQWARIHQYGGGMYQGKPVARRPFLGMNQADVAAILRIFQEAKGRIMAKDYAGAGERLGA